MTPALDAALQPIADVVRTAVSRPAHTGQWLTVPRKVRKCPAPVVVVLRAAPRGHRFMVGGPPARVRPMGVLGVVQRRVHSIRHDGKLGRGPSDVNTLDVSNAML